MKTSILFLLYLSPFFIFAQSMDKANISFSVAELYMNAKCKSTTLPKKSIEKGAFKIDYEEVAQLFNPKQRKRFKCVTYRKVDDALVYVGRGFSIHKAPVVLEGQEGEFYAFFWTTDADRVMLKAKVKDQAVSAQLFNCK